MCLLCLCHVFVCWCLCARCLVGYCSCICVLCCMLCVYIMFVCTESLLVHLCTVVCCVVVLFLFQLQWFVHVGDDSFFPVDYGFCVTPLSYRYDQQHKEATEHKTHNCTIRHNSSTLWVCYTKMSIKAPLSLYVLSTTSTLRVAHQRTLQQHAHSQKWVSQQHTPPTVPAPKHALPSSMRAVVHALVECTAKLASFQQVCVSTE